jgi:hypothetical protein
LALVYNWWSLFSRLLNPDQHHEAVTSRPLMLQAIGRKTAHAGQTIVTVTSTHAKVSVVQAAMRDLARWLYPAERQPCDCERFIDPEKPGDQMNY